MDPPTTIHIAPFEYELHFDPSRVDKASLRHKIGLWGYCDTIDKQVIGIDPTISEAGKRALTIHEVIHAILDASGYGNPKKVKDLEQFINVLSSGLLGLVRTNHQLVAWLADIQIAPETPDHPESPESPESPEEIPDAVPVAKTGLGSPKYPRWTGESYG